MIDYDRHDWRSHLFDIRGSMVREIFCRVALCVLWSIGVACLAQFGVVSFEFAQNFWHIPHALIGVFLSLLLVFRTNSSYERFWEGRKQWGAIVNESRNLARLAVAVLAADAELARRLIGWAIAFPYATMHFLRGQKGLGAAAQSIERADVQSALEANHLPLVVARRMTHEIVEAFRRGLMTDHIMVSLDANVQQLVDYMGACERIRNTPMPYAYMVHLRRALILYCFSLPLVLVNVFGWWTVLVTLLIAYTLFGIEEIGAEIENPFGGGDNDLPLDQICANIELNLREIMSSLPAAPNAARDRDDESTILLAEATRSAK